jgi:hypothetical protein
MLQLTYDKDKKSQNKRILKVFSYRDSRSGSINGVAPKGSMFASSILLIIELPAMEAASPALKPEWQNEQVQEHTLGESRDRTPGSGLTSHTSLQNDGVQGLLPTFIKG